MQSSLSVLLILQIKPKINPVPREIPAVIPKYAKWYLATLQSIYTQPTPRGVKIDLLMQNWLRILGQTTKQAKIATTNTGPNRPWLSMMPWWFILGVTSVPIRPEKAPARNPIKIHAPMLSITSASPPTIIPPAMVPMMMFSMFTLPLPARMEVTQLPMMPPANAKTTRIAALLKRKLYWDYELLDRAPVKLSIKVAKIKNEPSIDRVKLTLLFLVLSIWFYVEMGEVFVRAPTIMPYTPPNKYTMIVPQESKQLKLTSLLVVLQPTSMLRQKFKQQRMQKIGREKAMLVNETLPEKAVIPIRQAVEHRFDSLKEQALAVDFPTVECLNQNSWALGATTKPSLPLSRLFLKPKNTSNQKS